MAHPSLLEFLLLRPLHFFYPFIPPLSTTTLILDLTLVLADFTPFHVQIVHPSCPCFLHYLHSSMLGFLHFLHFIYTRFSPFFAFIFARFSCASHFFHQFCMYFPHPFSIPYTDFTYSLCIIPPFIMLMLHTVSTVFLHCLC
jgi:hypothetical protein